MSIMNYILHRLFHLLSKKAGVFVAGTASGAPTKEFFVGMLTRDIELSDAILDLLDNCLDGVVRQKKDVDKRHSKDYYEGFYAHITISKDSFIIEDNCGGIPRDVAEKYAFRMGRSANKTEDELPTVGIYGIGMKRAIFKIGKTASVTTCHQGKAYRVTIPLDWSTNESEWDFPIEEIDETSNDTVLASGGTRIVVTSINEEISNEWNTDDKLGRFIEDLIKAVRQSYSFILQKGFRIEVNGNNVQPLPIQLLVSEKVTGEAVKPFLYQATYGDVDVSLAVGFYAPPPSPDDLDDENEMRRSSMDAGWTIVCNDRVVLYNDRSHLTGWGEAGVPKYHTQFIGIRGIVLFESKNPKSLPMTTTKRGVDTSSSVYSAVKDQMRKGLKMFTDYTNRWKGQNEGERIYSTAAQNVSVDLLTKPHKEVEATTSVEFTKYKGAFVFNPKLPKPANDKPFKRISFSRSEEDILTVVEYFYEDRTHPVKPSQVGEKCFEMILEQAKNRRE